MRRIELAKIIAPTLSSRDVASLLDHALRETDDHAVIFDFQDVTFISRSAAHELTKLQDAHRHFWSRKRIRFENVSADVQVLLRAVRKQLRTRRTLSVDVPTVDFAEFSKLESR